MCTFCRSVAIPSEAWDHVTRCRLLSSWICRRFGGNWSLSLQSTSIAAPIVGSMSPTSSVTTPSLRMPFVISCIFVPEWLNFLTWRWRRLVSAKRNLLIVQRHVSEANARVCLVTILTCIVDTMSMSVCLSHLQRNSIPFWRTSAYISEKATGFLAVRPMDSRDVSRVATSCASTL